LDGEVFHCCNAYLKKAALLNDGVLVSFLTQVQEHLENVQIFLGKIETWLSEPVSSTQFLNELFGNGAALIEDVNGSMCKPGAEVYHSAMCILCCESRSSHIRRDERYGHFYTNAKELPRLVFSIVLHQQLFSLQTQHQWEGK
jgi:hypothetical protein